MERQSDVAELIWTDCHFSEPSDLSEYSEPELLRVVAHILGSYDCDSPINVAALESIYSEFTIRENRVRRFDA